MAIKGKKIGCAVAWKSKGKYLEYSYQGKIVAVVGALKEMPKQYSRLYTGAARCVDDRQTTSLRDHESYVVEVIQDNGLARYFHPPVNKLTFL